MKLKLNWDQLRPIQNNKIVSSLYVWLVIVPIVAKLFSKIESDVKINLGGKEIILDLHLPFSWELFFFSALSFVLGNILYLIFSPKIIKDYKNFGNFKEVGGTDAHLSEYKDEVLRMESADVNRLKTLIGATPKTNQTEHEKNEETRNLFWRIYNYFNKSKIYSKCFVAIFYLFGFILFAIVAITNIAWVLKQVINF